MDHPVFNSLRGPKMEEEWTLLLQLCAHLQARTPELHFRDAINLFSYHGLSNDHPVAHLAQTHSIMYTPNQTQSRATSVEDEEQLVTELGKAVESSSFEFIQPVPPLRPAGAYIPGDADWGQFVLIRSYVRYAIAQHAAAKTTMMDRSTVDNGATASPLSPFTVIARRLAERVGGLTSGPFVPWLWYRWLQVAEKFGAENITAEDIYSLFESSDASAGLVWNVLTTVMTLSPEKKTELMQMKFPTGANPVRTQLNNLANHFVSAVKAGNQRFQYQFITDLRNVLAAWGEEMTVDKEVGNVLRRILDHTKLFFLPARKTTVDFADPEFGLKGNLLLGPAVQPETTKQHHAAGEDKESANLGGSNSNSKKDGKKAENEDVHMGEDWHDSADTDDDDSAEVDDDSDGEYVDEEPLVERMQPNVRTRGGKAKAKNYPQVLPPSSRTRSKMGAAMQSKKPAAHPAQTLPDLGTTKTLSRSGSRKTRTARTLGSSSAASGASALSGGADAQQPAQKRIRQHSPAVMAPQSGGLHTAEVPHPALHSVPQQQSFDPVPNAAPRIPFAVSGGGYVGQGIFINSADGLASITTRNFMAPSDAAMLAHLHLAPLMVGRTPDYPNVPQQQPVQPSDGPDHPSQPSFCPDPASQQSFCPDHASQPTFCPEPVDPTELPPQNQFPALDPMHGFCDPSLTFWAPTVIPENEVYDTGAYYLPEQMPQLNNVPLPPQSMVPNFIQPPPRILPSQGIPPPPPTRLPNRVPPQTQVQSSDGAPNGQFAPSPSHSATGGTLNAQQPGLPSHEMAPQGPYESEMYLPGQENVGVFNPYMNPQ